MRKGSDILGKPVVAFDSGERFQRVKDLIFDQDSNQLLALLVGEGGWFSDAQVIPFQGIQAIGNDAILVPSESTVVRSGQLAEIKQILDRNNILKGTHIMTTDGRDLGRMIDLYFDEQTGVIEGYEVSGGLFADAYSGRSYVPAPHTLKIGEHVAFVPSEVADLMEEQVGGIKAAVLNASEKVQVAAQTAGDKIQVAAQETGHKLQEASRTTVASVTNAIVSPEEQKEFALGKTAQEDIKTPSGSIIVKQGQSITWWDAERAEENGVLNQLYRAAGGRVTQRAGEKLQVSAQQANSKLKNVADRAGETLQMVSRDATASLTNAVVDPAEQKAFAIGRTAEWTVDTSTGVIVVLAGQEVTATIAEQAERLNVLDELYRATGGRIRDQLAVRADSTAAGYVVEQAKGRRVQNIVRARSGFIVAAPGQIVTDSVIERAKLQRTERELLNAVGLSTSTAIRHRANDTASSVGSRFNQSTQVFGDQFYQGTVQVTEGARSLWYRMKQVANEWQSRSARAFEEQRIKGALGRPVTRVILDENDEIILNVGELITHRSIAAARRAGVLDALLNSVYTHAPQFSKAEMSAPESGKASLSSSN